jgi:hypothetical protein
MSRYLSTLCFVTCFVFSIFPHLAVADFTSLTIKLNSSAGGDQINPSMASLPDDKFVVIWSDRAGNDGDRGGIFGRIYTSGFEPLSPEFLVNTLTSDWQSKSNVASAVNGNFMAVWHQSNGYVEGQVFDASGTKLGPQFTVHTGFNGNSDVAADSNGDFWVVSTVNNGKGYVSKFSNVGELLVGPEVFHETELPPSDPVVTGLADGQMLVSWYDGGNTSGSDVYGQLINSDGARVGGEFLLNTVAAENQIKPAIAGLQSGGFVAVWQSFLQDDSLYGIYARIFDATGVAGEEFKVNADTLGNQTQPYALAKSEGGFIIGWTNLEVKRVYMQSYAPDGTAEDTNQVVSQDGNITVNDSKNMELTELTSGLFIAAWDAWKGSFDIFARSFELVIPDIDLDTDGDGVLDDIDAFVNNSAASIDTDADGMPDDWNDGCDETCVNGSGLTLDLDDDNDGYSDVDELANGTNPLSNTSLPLDTDGDFISNLTDSDDDNDNILDSADTYPLVAIGDFLDADADGAPNDCDENCVALGMAADTDDDNDGLADTADAYPLVAIGELLDTDSDGLPNDCDTSCIALGMTADTDDDNDGIKDISTYLTFYTTNNLSSELRELPNFVETLTKPDLIRGKLELNSPIIPDYRLTSYSNPVTAYEILVGSYEIGPSTQQLDNEIRIVSDERGRALHLYIWPKSTKEIDGKQVTGIYFIINLPEDFNYEAGQTLDNVEELFVLTNNRFNSNSLSIWWEESGRTGNLDITYNSFQIVDIYPLIPIGDLVDTDNDGAPDTCEDACIALGMAADEDDDNDGISDMSDVYPLISILDIGEFLDTDSDGAPDTCDAACVELGMAADSDDDNDGVLDTADAYPLVAIGELLDTDSDGIPNDCDTSCIALGMAADSDDDNDGVLDTADAYPLVSIGDLVDTDNDGAPDTCDDACVELGMAADSDDDNDGVLDAVDAFPLDATETADTDGDLIGNNADTDDDNDGLPDTYEQANGLDLLDADDAELDKDGDGLTNLDEFNNNTNPQLADSDGDNINDADEIRFGLDPTVSNDNVRLESQLITTANSIVRMSQSGKVAVSYNYNVSDGNAELSGLGVTVFFDSTVLSYDNTGVLLSNGFVSSSSVGLDLDDVDKDSTTDSYVQYLWLDINNAWPSALNVPLMAVNFDAVALLEGDEQTHINIASEALQKRNVGSDVVIYTVQQQATTVTAPADFTLDVNGDGAIDGFTDGFILLRYMFGFPEDSIATVDEMIGATLSKAQIYAVLQQADLDINGDGQVDGFTDGFIILRFIFGFPADSIATEDELIGATRSKAEMYSLLNSFK